MLASASDTQTARCRSRPSIGRTNGRVSSADTITATSSPVCAGASTGTASGSMKVASYPALVTAATSCSRDTDGSAWTVAFSVARLTDTCPTPGTFASAFSTRRTHDAHVIPPIASSAVTDVADVAAGLTVETDGADMSRLPGSV